MNKKHKILMETINWEKILKFIVIVEYFGKYCIEIYKDLIQKKNDKYNDYDFSFLTKILLRE